MANPNNELDLLKAALCRAEQREKSLLKLSREILATLEHRSRAVAGLCIEGLYTDGAHHKQWYLEQILEACGAEVQTSSGPWEPGIAP